MGKGCHIGDIDMAGAVGQFLHPGLGISDLLQDGARMGKKKPAGFGQNDAATPFFEQCQADFSFQLVDGPAQRGLGDAQFFGRLVEMFQLRGFIKVFKLFERDHIGNLL